MPSKFVWTGDKWLIEQRSAVLRNLRRAAIHCSNEIKKTLNESSYPPASSPNDPPAVRTGILKNSVQWTVDDTALVARIGSNLEYARFLEFGTSKMEPRPGFRLTYEEQKERLREILKGGK